jgi:hypothetical protein
LRNVVAATREAGALPRRLSRHHEHRGLRTRHRRVGRRGVGYRDRRASRAASFSRARPCAFGSGIPAVAVRFGGIYGPAARA